MCLSILSFFLSLLLAIFSVIELKNILKCTHRQNQFRQFYAQCNAYTPTVPDLHRIHVRSYSTHLAETYDVLAPLEASCLSRAVVAAVQCQTLPWHTLPSVEYVVTIMISWNHVSPEILLFFMFL